MLISHQNHQPLPARSARHVIDFLVTLTSWSTKAKKNDLEVKKFDLESKTFNAELELKRAEQEQAIVLHREAMELKKREIDVQHKSLQLPLTQHQEEMRLRFLEFEQRLKN